jgi:glutamyl-tRNA synthetase
MSKRDVTSEQSIFVLALHDLGYVPEAIDNWIALMGASFGPDERLLSLPDMIQLFDLDHLTPAAARVNFDKLDHFNGLYLRQLAPDDLAERVKPFFVQAGLPVDDQKLRQVVPIIQQRIVTLDEAVDMGGFFFGPSPRPSADALTGKGLTQSQSYEAIRRAHQVIAAILETAFTHEALEAALRALADELSLKPGQLFGILRVAVTGQTVSPPLFETMAVLGRQATLERVAWAEEQLRLPAKNAISS